MGKWSEWAEREREKKWRREWSESEWGERERVGYVGRERGWGVRVGRESVWGKKVDEREE